MRSPGQEYRTIVPVALAWLVHALTASGAFLAFLAFTAIEQGAFRTALLWLFVALLVDGVDGPLARRIEVRRRLPHIDGPTLDLVVDYLNYVFLPTILIYRAGLMPGWFELCGAAMIQLSALYHFRAGPTRRASTIISWGSPPCGMSSPSTS